jgi:hypothetical protein
MYPGTNIHLQNENKYKSLCLSSILLLHYVNLFPFNVSMNNEFIADITSIKQAIENKKLVVFAGAGISMDSGVPGWSQLVEQLKKDIEVPPGEADPLRIAQMYFNKRGQKELFEKLKTVLQYRQTKYNGIHEAIFELRPEHILTTNFDDLLEQVMEAKAEPFSVVRHDGDFPYALNTNLLVKVHGDFEAPFLVLKEDDYLAYAAAHPLLESFIKSVFSSKVVLFVGYSFSDIDLKMILHSVRHILGADFQKAFLLSIDQPFHSSQREYLKEKGIVAINYSDANLPDGSNFMEGYLKGNNCESKNYYKADNHLSPRGQQLLTFLSFIRRYDYFNEDLRTKHPIEQMYQSLIRFGEVRSLPPQFLEKLFPFTISGNTSYELWNLHTDNVQLLQVLMQCVNTGKGLTYKPEDAAYSESQLEDFNKKLRYIACVLNYSYVFSLSPTYELEEQLKEEVGPVRINNHLPDQCDCFNCLLKRFDFKKLMLKMEHTHIHPGSETEQDLLFAFIHYRVGLFRKSFALFEEAAAKAWNMRKLISYYIAKQNSKYLKMFLKGYEYSESEADQQLFHKIDDLDLDFLIHRTSKPGTAELKLLRIIKYDEIIDKAIKKIDEYRTEILATYELYKEGGMQFGGKNFTALVSLELVKLYSFYSYNYLIADEFTSLKKTCQKGIEALLINYATSNEYEGRIHNLDRLFFDVFLLYGDAKAMETITGQYAINELTFPGEDLDYILDLALRFLNSMYNDSPYGPVEEDWMRKLKAVHFFRNKLRAWTSNLFIILSGVKFSPDKIGQLVVPVKKFLQIEDFLYWNNTKYIASFITHHHQAFTMKDIEELLKICKDKKGFYMIANGLMVAFDYVAAQNPGEKIKDKDLVLQVANKTGRTEIIYLVYLWKMSSDDIRQVLKERIVAFLNENVHFELYRLAVNNDIIDPYNYLDSYIKKYEGRVGAPYFERNGQIFPNELEFLNLIWLLYSKQFIPVTRSELSCFSNLPSYMKFFLDPFNYDYVDFDVHWLHLIDGEHFFQVFSKIPQIKNVITQALKTNFNEDLALIYAKCFLPGEKLVNADAITPEDV